MSDPAKARFIERRSGRNRRQEPDPCAELPVDLYHRKRRKQAERRTPGRSLEQHQAAYYGSLLSEPGETEELH